ncbi:unnamed protein product, partial [marine sediment metagenome]
DRKKPAGASFNLFFFYCLLGLEIKAIIRPIKGLSISERKNVPQYPIFLSRPTKPTRILNAIHRTITIT